MSVAKSGQKQEARSILALVIQLVPCFQVAESADIEERDRDPEMILVARRSQVETVITDVDPETMEIYVACLTNPLATPSVTL